MTYYWTKDHKDYRLSTQDYLFCTTANNKNEKGVYE